MRTLALFFWSAAEGATRVDTARLDPDDDECLWTGDVVIEERSEWEDRGDDAQASIGRASETRNFLIGRYWESVGVTKEP